MSPHGEPPKDSDLRRLVASLNSIRFRDERGEVEYFGQKVVLLRRDAFSIIRKELSKIAGAAANIILGMSGKSVGASEGRALMEKARSMRLDGPATFREFIKTAVEETNIGIGKIQIDEMNLVESSVKLSVDHGFEAETSGGSFGPSCFFTRGYFEGIFSMLLTNDVKAEETSCKATNGEPCKYNIFPRH